MAQDSMAIVHKIDSIWKVKLKTTKEKFKSSFDSVHYRIWYSKATKEVILVEETHYPVSTDESKFWIYDYHFRAGKLVLITKYNNYDIRSPKRKICYYYFADNELLYKHEFKISIPNIEDEKKKAFDLKRRFEKS